MLLEPTGDLEDMDPYCMKCKDGHVNIKHGNVDDYGIAYSPSADKVPGITHIGF